MQTISDPPPPRAGYPVASAECRIWNGRSDCRASVSDATRMGGVSQERPTNLLSGIVDKIDKAG